MQTVVFAIDKNETSERFSVENVESFGPQADDPGFTRYTISPLQARVIITRLWQMLDDEDRPSVTLEW